MLKSMTGYGEAATQDNAFALRIEIKSVNNRFLKISSKLPEEISYLQNDLEDEVRKSLQRGSVSVTVRFDPTSNVDLYEIDEDVLKKYFLTLNRLTSELNSTEQILVKDLLLLPGVIQAETTAILGRDHVFPVANGALKQALSAVVEMRSREGQALESEFRARSQELKSLVADVKRRYPRDLNEHHTRLKERVDSLLQGKDVSVDSEDLIREVAIIAERADIAEEISRMESHLEQFIEALDSTEPVGRKLEFLVQEMFRECNTMASKSMSNELNKSIVEMKAEITRLKEQVLNVE